MTEKAMERIGLECMVYAEHPEDFARETKKQGGFDPKLFHAYCDQRAREEWSARYPRWKVVCAYLDRIMPIPESMGGHAPMDRREAVEDVARLFGFPSFDACYQYLKRQKVPLPPNWPKA